MSHPSYIFIIIITAQVSVSLWALLHHTWHRKPGQFIPTELIMFLFLVRITLSLIVFLSH